MCRRRMYERGSGKQTIQYSYSYSESDSDPCGPAVAAASVLGARWHWHSYIHAFIPCACRSDGDRISSQSCVVGGGLGTQVLRVWYEKKSVENVPGILLLLYQFPRWISHLDCPTQLHGT